MLATNIHHIKPQLTSSLRTNTYICNLNFCGNSNNSTLPQVQSSLTAQELESYGDAGAVVEEVLSSLRTVVAFGGENKEVARYKFSAVMQLCIAIPLLSQSRRS
jgi:hypothetical protein